MDGYGINTTSLACLIETLYQAVEDPHAWSKVMRLLCGVMRADSGLIRLYPPDWSTVDLTATHGFDPAFNAAYQQHFVHIDPITRAIEQLGMPPGYMAVLPELLPDRELKRTEFYNDYLRPQDKRHIMGGHLLLDDDTRVLIGFQRGHRGPAFEPADKSPLQILIPHFQQSIRLGQTLRRATARAAAATHALDQLRLAAFFLDRQGDLGFANARGEAELHAGTLLTLRGRRLHATDPGRDRVLQQLIASMNPPASSDRYPAAGGALQLAAQHEAGHIVTAIVSPWHSGLQGLDGVGPAVASAVFVGAPHRPRLQAPALIGAFGLTRAEARLAAGLVKTCDLAKAADAAGVTKSTARSYLKSIFEKTGCRSQVELVTLILTSPGGLWGRKLEVSNETQAVAGDPPGRRPPHA